MCTSHATHEVYLKHLGVYRLACLNSQFLRFAGRERSCTQSQIPGRSVLLPGGLETPASRVSTAFGGNAVPEGPGNAAGEVGNALLHGMLAHPFMQVGFGPVRWYTALPRQLVFTQYSEEVERTLDCVTVLCIVTA